MPEKNLPLEIERKFLVKEIPGDYSKYIRHDIIQGYVPLSGDKKGFRLRKMDEKFYETIKMENTDGIKLSRIEVEIELSRGQFDSLWPLAAPYSLEKTRYEIPYKNHIIELDIYKGPLSGFHTAEVEFGSAEDAEKFDPPGWFGTDVSGDQRYSNHDLSFYGLPGPVRGSGK